MLHRLVTACSLCGLALALPARVWAAPPTEPDGEDAEASGPEDAGDEDDAAAEDTARDEGGEPDALQRDPVEAPPAVLVKPLLQRLSGNVFHHQVRNRLVFDRINRDDVLMPYGGRRAGLAKESLYRVLVSEV